MRDRLIAAFVGLTVVVVALYGIPRAYFLADLIRTDAQERVNRSADLVAAAVDAGTATTPDALDALSTRGEWIEIRTAGGQVISSTHGPADDGDISATHPLGDGGTVTVTREADEIDDAIADALLPLVLIGLGLVVVAGLAGSVIARRLARPFQELASAARDLGTGARRPELPTYRVPEAQAIGEALTVSGDRIDLLLRHERELAVHASHELRTPITALRIDLEDLALWPETTPAVAEALTRSTGELDRLSAAIGDLLDRAREQLAGDEIDLDLDALVADVVARLDGPDLRLTHAASVLAPTRLDPELLRQVVEHLRDEALDHGVRTLELGVTDRGTHHEVRLTPDDAATATSGPSWRAAAELAAALGGQLTREPGSAVAVLRVPKRALSKDA